MMGSGGAATMFPCAAASCKVTIGIRTHRPLELQDTICGPRTPSIRNFRSNVHTSESRDCPRPNRWQLRAKMQAYCSTFPTNCGSTNKNIGLASSCVASLSLLPPLSPSPQLLLLLLLLLTLLLRESLRTCKEQNGAKQLPSSSYVPEMSTPSRSASSVEILTISSECCTRACPASVGKPSLD